MHNIHDKNSICTQNVNIYIYIYLKSNVKWGTRNTKFKVINQHIKQHM